VIPATAELGPAAATLASVGGAAYGLVRPPTLLRGRTPLPRAIPGAPAPLGSLGVALGRDLEAPIAASIVVAAIVGIGPLASALALVSWTDARPSMLLLGFVAVASFAAAVATLAALPPFLLRGTKRAAFVAHSWLGARETARSLGSRHAAARLVGLPDTATDWIAGHPEDDRNRPLHAELHLMRGDLAAAAATIERLPRRTPQERFDRAMLEAVLSYQTTGQVDEDALRAAADAMPPGPQAVEAEVALAAFEARRRLPGGDWRRPLAAARAAIAESDVAILVRDFAAVTLGLLMRRTWPIAVGLVLTVVVIGLVVDGVL